MEGNTAERCPDCDAVRSPGGALAGLCPQCLFTLALAESEIEELPTLVGGKRPAPGEILGERYQKSSSSGSDR